MNPFAWTATWVANLPGIRTRIACRIADRACDALEATAAGDCKVGHRITNEMLGRYGAGAAYPLVMAWSGAFVDCLGLPPGHQEPVGLAFRNPSTGQTATADEVPPRVRWSGQVLAARAANDHETVFALINALPDDELEFERHLGELLHTAALALAARKGEDTAS